mmetsp:Transcript_10691/g.29715  ORF Transcript_10691/g.29715 Transcript_10691/m.29715 type:complete len:231 (-) Transcript_10691:156-848(-)
MLQSYRVRQRLVETEVVFEVEDEQHGGALICVTVLFERSLVARMDRPQVSNSRDFVARQRLHSLHGVSIEGFLQPASFQVVVSALLLITKVHVALGAQLFQGDAELRHGLWCLECASEECHVLRVARGFHELLRAPVQPNKGLSVLSMLEAHLAHLLKHDTTLPVSPLFATQQFNCLCVALDRGVLQARLLLQCQCQQDQRRSGTSQHTQCLSARHHHLDPLNAPLDGFR